MFTPKSPSLSTEVGDCFAQRVNPELRGSRCGRGDRREPAPAVKDRPPWCLLGGPLCTEVSADHGRRAWKTPDCLLREG